MIPHDITALFLGPLITLITQYWWILLLIVAASILRPKIKGWLGEVLVNFTARLRLDSDVYRLLKDVTISAREGTTQIDHVIVSVFGVFVIETKNYSGWIFADEDSPKWTQVNFKQKHSFQNPLRQNYAHICAVSDLLNIPKDKIHGVVCFIGDAKFKADLPKGVFLEGSYVSYIQSFRDEVFSVAEKDDLIQRIESSRLRRGYITNRSHVQNLKTRHSELPSSGKACPNCGAVMVLRTVKKGVNIGAQFWGCSRYPLCRTTQAV